MATIVNRVNGEAVASNANFDGATAWVNDPGNTPTLKFGVALFFTHNVMELTVEEASTMVKELQRAIAKANECNGS